MADFFLFGRRGLKSLAATSLNFYPTDVMNTAAQILQWAVVAWLLLALVEEILRDLRAPPPQP